MRFRVLDKEVFPGSHRIEDACSNQLFLPGCTKCYSRRNLRPRCLEDGVGFNDFRADCLMSAELEKGAR